MKKRFLPILFALVLCLTLLPTVALADGDGVTTADNLIDAVKSDGTVTLGADIALSNTLTITGTVTLDLNGHTLTGANGSQDDLGNCGDGGTAITVQSSGALTIKDTSTGSTIGSIVGGNGCSAESLVGCNGGNGGSAITVEGGGSLIVSGGTIKGGNGGNGGSGNSGGGGGAAITANSGSLTVSGGSIVGGNGGKGGISGGCGGSGGSGIEITDGTVNITGGSVTGGKGSNGTAGTLDNGGSGGAGGNGLLIKGGSVTVGGSGAIIGGDAGTGGFGSFGGSGGNGLLIKGGTATINSGTINGGNGGTGGEGHTIGGAGGAGGAGLSVTGGTVTINNGTINGGNGGNGGKGGDGADEESRSGGAGGNGGEGLSVTAGTVTVGGSGTISGGTGGNGGATGSDGYSDGAPGTPGKAILTSGKGSIGVSSADALTKALSLGATSIKLTGNIELSDTLNITKDLTLDLNGHTLTANGGIQVGDMTSTGGYGDSAKLTINDSSADGSGKLIATGLNFYDDSEVEVIDLITSQNYGIWCNGALTVNGGTVSATGADNRPNKDGSVTSYGIFVNGTLTVNGGNVTGTGGYVGLSDTAEGTLHDAGSFGIVANHISVTGGSVTGSGGTANGASSTSNGIEAQLGSLTVTGGTVKGTYAPAAYFTKAIYANQVTLLSISGGTFNGALGVCPHSSGCTSSLSGGTFNDGITVWNTTPNSLLAAGYCYQVNGTTTDGADVTTLGGSGNPVVVEKATITVSDAAALISAVKNDGTVKLTDNITLGSTLTVTGTVTLDLNGHVLKYSSTNKGSVIKVAGGGKLTLTDSAPTATHSDTSLPAGGIITGGTGTQQILGEYIYYLGGGVYNEGTFTMNGGTITGCGFLETYYDSSVNKTVYRDTHGGGVYNLGTFLMNGGTIQDCRAIYGSGVQNAGYDSRFTMSGGSITNCTGILGAGVSNGGTFTISGTAKIENCTILEHDLYESVVFQNSGSNYNSVTMYANGGFIAGRVYNEYDELDGYSSTITRTATGDDSSTYTTFDGEVVNGNIEDVAKLTVTFDLNGGTGTAPKTQKVLKGQKAEQPTTDPTREGYTFDGWYTAQTGGTKFDFNSAVTGNTTLYAKWTLNTYTVTFDPNGGTVTPDFATTDTNGNVTSLPTPTRSGYAFDGWFTAKDGGTEITADTVFGGNTTVYAHWTYVPVYIPAYSVTAPTAANGAVTVSPKNAVAGTTVTVTAAPDAGYALEALTVTDRNGRAVELTDLGNGKYSFKMPAGSVTVKATFMEDNTMLNFFTDVTADKYYYDAVLWAARNGITGGVDETHFGPDRSCTRAQLVTFLWRAAGCPVVNYAMDFSDVGDDYYTEAVRWAASLGIVGGYGNGLFGTNDTITREQVVTILYRYVQAQGGGFTGTWMFRMDYTDLADMSDWAYEAVAWCSMNGILQGYDGKIMPKDTCTRAQIVTMLYRLLGE